MIYDLQIPSCTGLTRSVFWKFGLGRLMKIIGVNYKKDVLSSRWNHLNL
jgi:hypothetical protein